MLVSKIVDLDSLLYFHNVLELCNELHICIVTHVTKKYVFLCRGPMKTLRLFIFGILSENIVTNIIQVTNISQAFVVQSIK